MDDSPNGPKIAELLNPMQSQIIGIMIKRTACLNN